MAKKIMVSTRKAMKVMNIISGSVNIAAGFIASIGINEIYKRIDKTDASRCSRYMMECGARAVTLAVTTPYIVAGVKQLFSAYSDEKKLVSAKVEDDTGRPEEAVDESVSEYDSDAMMALKNEIIEMIKTLTAKHGDLQYRLSTFLESRINDTNYRIFTIYPTYAVQCREIIDKITEYNNIMHKTLGDSYKFDTLRLELIDAAKEIANEMGTGEIDEVPPSEQ